MSGKGTDPRPCPFCGSEADIYQAKGYRRLSTRDSKFRVRCSNKHCIAHYLTLYSPSKAVVVEAWNRRAER